MLQSSDHILITLIKYSSFYLSIFQVTDVLEIHEKACPRIHERKVQLSCDGIVENKSSPVSIDVYSIKFNACKNVYPLKLIRPLNKHKIDKRRHFSDVLNDITQNGLRITQFIGDNPKRSDAKECKCSSAWYACEYCYAKGCKLEVSDNVRAKTKITQQIDLVQEKINQCESEPETTESLAKVENLKSLKEELMKSLNALKRKSNILWPHSTMIAQHRSRASILEIIEKIENQEPLPIDQSKGIMGRSLLMDLPEFNFTYDSPAEYMHSGCIGVIKRLVEITFSVGVKRPKFTTRKMSSVENFNKFMLVTKVTREFPRRARRLDPGVFKALEYRNLVLFFFPFVLKCIEPKEIELWLNLVYMLRSSVIPSVEYSKININQVNECCSAFYKLYEEIFGPQNCTYSFHVFVSHLLEIRTHGPLTETSAFKFESFYGEIRRSFVSGTNSPLKQVLKNIMLKRALSPHVCEKNIYISNYDTPMECNSLIYCYKNDAYLIYKIKDIEDNIVTCNKVGQYPVHFEETPHLTWSTVGVFKKGGVCSDNFHIETSEISGKVLNVGNYLITCPINVLQES